MQRRSTLGRRSVTLVMILLTGLPLTGCQKWVFVPDPVPAIVTADPRTMFRFVLASGDTTWLRGPRLIGDSITGASEREGRLARPIVARKDIVEARRRTFDAVGTFIGLGILATIGFIGGIAASFGG